MYTYTPIEQVRGCSVQGEAAEDLLQAALTEFDGAVAALREAGIPVTVFHVMSRPASCTELHCSRTRRTPPSRTRCSQTTGYLSTRPESLCSTRWPPPTEGSSAGRTLWLRFRLNHEQSIQSSFYFCLSLYCRNRTV